MPVGNIATAGSGGDYATVGEAVAAGYTEIHVISDTTEAADITYGERLSILFLAEYQVDMVGFQFLATAGVTESWLSITGIGTVRFSYSGTKDLFRSAVAGEEDMITHLLLERMHILNQSTATKGGICGWASVDTQTSVSAISPLCIVRYCKITLPNFADTGFYCFSPDGDLSVALKHHFQEVQFVGGGTACTNGLVSGFRGGIISTRKPNYFKHDQLTFSGTWSATVNAAAIAGETLGVTITGACVFKVGGLCAGVTYAAGASAGSTYVANSGTHIGIVMPTGGISGTGTFINCQFNFVGTFTITSTFGAAFYGCRFGPGAQTFDSGASPARWSNCIFANTATFKTAGAGAIVEGCHWEAGAGNITFDATSSGIKWINNTLDATAVTITDNGTNNFLGGLLVMRTKADQTINGNPYQNITRLTFPVAASKDYAFEFNLVFRVNTNITTGFGFSINGPTIGTGDVSYVTTYQTSANAVAGTDVMTQRHDTAYDAMVATAGTITAGVNLHCNIKGRLRNGATAGTLAARVRSELANNDLVVQKGCWGTWLELT